MSTLGILRGITGGVANATGNTQAASEIAGQQERERAAKANDLRTQLAPLNQALQSSQTRLALFADPNDPTKPIAGKESEYNAAHDQMADVIGKMRTILHPPPAEDPHGISYLGARALDKLHITRHLASEARAKQSGKVDAYYQQGNDQVQAATVGAQPYQNTPAGQAEKQRLSDSLQEIEARNANEGWTKNGAPVQVDDGKGGKKWAQPFTNRAGQTKMEDMPAGYSGPTPKPNTSQYAQQRDAFAKSINKTPETMSWADEQQFLSQRYNANQPLAQKKLAQSEARLHIDQQTLALRESQNNWKDFSDIYKTLTPLEKLQTTANLSGEYVSDPTGPGDVALTLAFFEVAKAADPGSGSGIRFTQQEQKLIQGSRGLADAAKANVERWGTGTLYDDNQRQQMADIIKMASAKATERESQYLGATGGLNPAASSAGASASGVTPPAGPKTKQLKAQQSGSNFIVVTPQDMKQ